MFTEEEFRRRAHELALERLKVIRAGENVPEICIYTTEEKNEYKKNIKHRCFICGYAYKNDFQQYLVRGNCCTPCNVRIASYLKKTISRAECDLQLVERIAFFKNNQ